jgi:hypothetical protein
MQGESSTDAVTETLGSARRAAFSREAAELGRLAENLDARARAARDEVLRIEQGHEADEGVDPLEEAVPVLGLPVSRSVVQSRSSASTPAAAERVLRVVRPIEARFSPWSRSVSVWIWVATAVMIILAGIGFSYLRKF